jgi:hypothetical protein
MYVREKLSSVNIRDQLWNEGVEVSYAGISNVLHDADVMRSRGDATKHTRFIEVRTCKHCASPFTIMNVAQVYCRICCPTKRAYQRLKYYGLSQPQYDQMFVDQRGQCATCNEALVEGGSTNLNIDHCHTTGKVRGLLCHRCNMIVGFLDKGDWRLNIQKIRAYIERHEP